jgi:FkbH-like protein
VKCVVWDLDNTLWNGTLLEDDTVTVRQDMVAIVRALDSVGILHSIASKNDHDLAVAKLSEAGIVDCFLYPQINWNPKSTSIRHIAAALNIGLDTLAFVDDQHFELAEVQHAVPEVMCIHAEDIAGVFAQPEFRPPFTTGESNQRRFMYLASAARDNAEREFVGTSEAFLATLDMRMRIAEADEEDLQRAEELTVRTNQLNSTGRTYSYEELDAFRTSPDHLLLVASLEDRFGAYGKIGLAVVERGVATWKLLLLLMSCRVVSRGVGTVLLNHVMRLAQEAGARLQADFVDTGRNRMMNVAFRFAGFREVDRGDTGVLLEATLDTLQPVPDYVTLEAA